MKMIVGLGNIGAEYAHTRHNIGFMTVDALAASQGANFKVVSKQHAMIAEINLAGEKILLVKPTTYMNESGQAVGPLMDYYNLALDDLLVVQDDMDMDLGRLRLRAKGSAGGHNGIKSIINHLGTQSFARLKFGIGHPSHQHQAVVDYVLGKFSKDEDIDVLRGTDKALEIFTAFADGDDLPTMMNAFN